MRTTISLPDHLAAEAKAMAGDRSLSDFVREALAARLDELKRQALAVEMEQGYRAEATSPSLETAWSDIETEGW